MAVDTAAKRHSALAFARPSVPLPDGTVAVADRIQLTWLYGGIAAEASTAVPDRFSATASRSGWRVRSG